MWDSRLARWTSTDPYGQFHSPYLGMGNNPVSGVDPDGGFWGTGSALLDAGITMAAGALVGGAIGGAVGGKEGAIQGMAIGAAAGLGAYGGAQVDWGSVADATLNGLEATAGFLGENAGAFAAGAGGFLNGFMQGKQITDYISSDENYKARGMQENLIKINKDDPEGKIAFNLIDLKDKIEIFNEYGDPIYKTGFINSFHTVPFSRLKALAKIHGFELTNKIVIRLSAGLDPKTEFNYTVHGGYSLNQRVYIPSTTVFHRVRFLMPETIDDGNWINTK